MEPGLSIVTLLSRRRRNGVLLVLAEACASRAVAVIEEWETEVGTGAIGSADREGGLGWRIRGRALVERLVADRPVGPVRFGHYMDRLATGALIASRGVGKVTTSFPDLLVDGVLARAIGLVLLDFLTVIETAAVDPAALELVVSAQYDGVDLLVGLAGRGTGFAPVPSCAGMTALTRADAIVRALRGWMTRGMEKGDMVFGVSFSTIVSGVDRRGGADAS